MSSPRVRRRQPPSPCRLLVCLAVHCDLRYRWVAGPAMHGPCSLIQWALADPMHGPMVGTRYACGVLTLRPAFTRDSRYVPRTATPETGPSTEFGCMWDPLRLTRLAVSCTFRLAWWWLSQTCWSCRWTDRERLHDQQALAHRHHWPSCCCWRMQHRVQLKSVR